MIKSTLVIYFKFMFDTYFGDFTPPKYLNVLQFVIFKKLSYFLKS